MYGRHMNPFQTDRIYHTTKYTQHTFRPIEDGLTIRSAASHVAPN